MLANTLSEFCRSLGLSQEEITRNETPAMHLVKTEAPAGEIKRLTPGALQSLVKSFGGAVSLTVGFPEAPLLEVVQGQLPADLDKKLAAIHKRDDQTRIHFELKLDKEKLLDQHGLDRSQVKGIYYLFLENLTAFLNSPLPQLDHLLFESRTKPTALILSSATAPYCGPLFYLFGNDDFAAARACVKPPRPATLERIEKYQNTALENLSWVGFKLEHLTPVHLLCAYPQDGLPEISLALTHHLLTLCILYTANRSSYNEKQFLAVYASSEQTAALSLGALETGNLEQGDLASLALWPYSGKETDRLTILQSVVAGELAEVNPAQNFGVFVARLKHLLTEARWHHRVFLDGQIGRHFEQVQSVADYITKMTQEVSKALDAVTKGLADNLLAAVGVIVLSLLASLVKSEVQSLIFLIGMRVYAAYLLVFQGIYRMASIWHSYSLLQQETDEQIAVYTQRLGKRKVEPLTQPFERRQEQFQTWFKLTLGLYVLFGILFWWLGGSLPAYLAQAGVIGATPAPTFTPGP